MANDRKWVNKIARILKKSDKQGGFKKGEFFFTLPLAEPVTLKLQRKTGEGFKVEEVTLVPETSDKGYSGVIFSMKEPTEYEYNGEKVIPRANVKFELSYMLPEETDENSEF